MKPTRNRKRSGAATAMVIAGLALISPRAALAQDDGHLRAQRQQVDAAIVRALEYLADRQRPSGAWTLQNEGEATSATSLAVMAFLAAGHVPGEGPYGDRISRGIDWVVAQQQPNGLLVSERGHGPMYSHGIATLMLAEAAGMTDEQSAKPLRAALERAIKLILESQNVNKSRMHAGGWRYQPRSSDSDLSVTAWQLLALRAAKNLGCDVPAENIDRAVEYVKRLSVADSGGFGYQSPHSPSPVRAGTGILALEICGDHHAPESMAAAEYLLTRPLRYNTHYYFYGAYYCTVGMFQVGGKYWEETRDLVAVDLIRHQERDGSWTARTGGERSAGLIYSTSMAVLALSVEYQYLPIYQR
ncbi:MAG: prenyltransferase/squalene oxidase repeat-containing protein [Planctomycetaceae bacterium]